MDISSGSAYPSSALSNFAPHPFTIDGVECASMEGFLQSLKFKNPDMQVEVCKLVGRMAKAKGRHKSWHASHTLWWRGKAIDRFSDEYQELLDRAYDALAENKKFQAALLASGDARLTHKIGKRNMSQTVLTKSEFCGRLTKIRDRLRDG